MTDTAGPIGVILHAGDPGIADLLAAFAARLRAEGIDVGGLVQRRVDGGGGRPRIEQIDVRTGQAFPITQDLGAGSQSCAIDTGGLAAASAVLRRETEARVALLVVNKFSEQEAEGRGLAPEMFDAVAEGIPVLTTLAKRYWPQWERLTGGAGTMLEPDEAALRRWWAEVCG
jgi:hypothetical protein